MVPGVYTNPTTPMGRGGLDGGSQQNSLCIFNPLGAERGVLTGHLLVSQEKNSLGPNQYPGASPGNPKAWVWAGRGWAGWGQSCPGLGLASRLLLFLLSRLFLVAVAACWGFGIPLASGTGQSGIAAWDVDVLAIVRHVLQGELGPIAGAQAHGASATSQGGASISGFTGGSQDHGLQHLCVKLVVGPSPSLVTILGAAGAWSLPLRETPVSVGRGLWNQRGIFYRKLGII